MARVVQTGPPAPDFSPVTTIALRESFNLRRAIVLDTSHIVKYYRAVHIVTRKPLSEAMQDYPDAANEIRAWVVIVEGVRWHNFAEVRLMFRDADYIDGYVVFNIRRNRFRLITVIHYAKTRHGQTILMRSSRAGLPRS